MRENDSRLRSSLFVPMRLRVPLPKHLRYHSPRFQLPFMCCPWLVLESCEVWLKPYWVNVSVPHHTIKMSGNVSGKMLGTQIAQWLQAALRAWAGWFENFKRKPLMKWWNKRTEATSRRIDWLVLWLAQMGAPSTVGQWILITGSEQGFGFL